MVMRGPPAGLGWTDGRMGHLRRKAFNRHSF